MKTFSLKIPQALEEKIERASRRRPRTKSELVRQALESFLQGEGLSPPGGAAPSLLDDLAGSLEGPPDLSVGDERQGFNPSHRTVNLEAP